MHTRFAIDIDLFPQPGAPPPDAAGVQSAVERYLEAWWPALGLPQDPAVQVHLRPEAADLFDFALQLEGRPVPVTVLHPARQAPLLAFRIWQALFFHRTALISDEHLRLLRRTCLQNEKTAPSWSSAPLSVWKTLATLLLKNGFSLNRLGQCIVHWTPEKSAEETFEQLIENPESLQLVLEAGPGLAVAHTGTDPGWEERFPEFYRDIYQDHGVLLPEVLQKTSDNLLFEQFILRLNDLPVPVLPGLSEGQALYEPTDEPASCYRPAEGIFYSTDPGDDVSRTPAVPGPRAYVMEWIKYWVDTCGSWFVNAGIIDALLDKLEESNRSLIVMIREQWPTHRLCPLLRQLLNESVSIRNLPEILDVLLRIEGTLVVDDTAHLLYFTPVNRVVTTPPGAVPGEFSIEQLAGQVRAGLKFPIVFPHLHNGILPCYNLEPALLRDLRDGFFENATPTPGSAFEHLLKTIRDQTDTGQSGPVLLVPTSIRPAATAALQPYFPQLVVLGHEEIPPFFIPQIKGMITTGGD